jgi:heat shock protein HslJ/uncharacterized membrane protein
MTPVLLMLALAGQSAPPAGAYSALGHDPAWSLTITDGLIALARPGQPTVSATARRSQGDGMVQYRAREIDVAILSSPCDGADGRRYADAVFVTVGAQEMGGCGGALLPAGSLDGTSWHLVEIAGSAIALTGDIFRDDVYAVDFGAEGFVGYGGCNRFSARFSRVGDMLTVVPPFMSTRHACAEPAMSREQRLFQILNAPVRVSFPDADTLVLTGTAGSIRLRRTRD